MGSNPTPSATKILPPTPRHIIFPRMILRRLLRGFVAHVDRRFNELDLKLTRMETKMSAEFDALTAQVHATRDIAASAVTLINGIADRIAAAGTDPVALQALTDELRASDDALAAAVQANTPVAPPAP